MTPCPHEEEAKRMREDYESACATIAAMHAAAVGEVRGPILGVVEDVAALRAEVVRLTNKLNTDSQNFEIIALRETERILRARNALLEKKPSATE